MNKNFPIKANVDPLTDILLKNRFITPRHQRPYAWEKKHVKWFLKDIAYGVKNKKSYHYFGPIMFIDTIDDKLIINDGQQRIVTLMLVCAYLCINFAEAGKSNYEKRAMRILFDLSAKHKKTMNIAARQTPRITLSQADHRIYKSLISSGVRLQKNSPIDNAWITIKEFFSDESSEEGFAEKKSSLEFKISFFEFMYSCLQVSWTEFKNRKDAITSFITQNARGKSLEQIQLTCTHFLRCLEDEEEQSKTISSHFDHIRNHFKSEKKFFDYTRCFAQCEHGHLSSNDFCVDISEKITDPDEAYKFVARLSKDDNINIFKNLNKKRHDPDYYKDLIKDGGHNNSLRNITDYLQDLGKYKSVSNAILFALLCQYFGNLDSSQTKKPTKTAKFVCFSSKLLASFFQRATHSFRRSFAPSKYEEQAACLAYAITQGTCKTSEEFLRALREFDHEDDIISDAHYKRRMRSISFPTTKAKEDDLKRILIAINEQMDKKSLIVPLEKISVEHILPESLDHIKEWDFNETDHGLHRYRLGNLALLPSHPKFATYEFNANLLAKQEEYEKSDYIITQKLSENSNWNIEALEMRQAELAKVASQVWNFNHRHNQKKAKKMP